MTGANEQALLNAVDAALQPSNPNGLTAFNTSLQGGTALGSDLPVVGTGLSAYNPGTVLGGLLARLGSTTYSSVASLTSALQTGSGITVQSTSDLLNNIELDLQFSATTAISVPLNPNYGVTFVDPGTLTMSTTLTENLTVGAYWDPNISAAVAYVDASNASISVASTATSFTFSPNSTGQLGFLEFDTPTTSVANISGNKLLSTTVSFSPTFTFSLNTQPPVDSAETSGRLTLAQLASVPLASLVNTSVTQPAAATLTVNLSTPLEPSASKIVFTWSDINSPTTVTSTLTSDPTLTVLNQFQAITAGTISGGLDQITGDLTAAATDAAGNTAGFNADLPLIGESINTLVNFAGTSTATAFFTQYLTSFTNPTTSSSGVSTEPFATDEQLLAILAGLPQQSLPTGVTIKSTKSSLTETASGSELIFTLDLDVLIDTEQAISLSPALNLVGLPMLYVQTAVNTQLSFGVLGTTGQFFITASTLPTAQVNVNGTVQDPSYTFPISTTYSGVGTLGYLAVNLTNATFNLAGTAALTITNPNTNNPPTPGIITANELDAGLQSSGTVLPVPANGTVSGTASAVLPMSPYNLTITGVSGATAVLTWSNVSAPSAYTLNTAALTPYIGFNGLSGSALYSALAELPSVLNGASDMSNLGQDLSFFGPNLGPTITLGNLFVTRTGIQASNASNAPATFQTLISALNSDLGFDLTLSSTSDGIQINLPLTQQFSGNVGWQVSEPVTTSAGTRTNFQASGSVPVSGTYTTTLDFGMVLTSSAAAATQFYLLGGSGGSGVTAAFVSNSTSLGASTANLGGNTVNLGGLEAVTGTVTMPLGTSTSAQRLTLSNPLTKPDSLYGKATTVGTATAYFNLSNLPPGGSSGSVTLGWSQVGMPSSISISANGLGSVSNVQSPSSAIQTGLSDLSSFVGEFSQSSTLETTLFLVNQTADQVINYPQDIKTAITQLQTAISTGSTLNTSILGASLGPNVSIAATSNNNPSGGQYEYALTFNFTQPSVANLPFNVQSGLDSNEQSLNITLQTNLAMTASFAGTLTFGYDAGDGFYIYGGSGGNALNLSTQVSTEASFPDDTVGTFGIIPFGVTGGTAGLTASVGLTLNAPGDNGEKISGMDLSADGATLLEPNVTGTGSLMLPFGARLGTGTSAPGVISSFTADWNPMRTQPVEYGASDGTSLLNGFGSVTYDYTEFVDDMLQPVLQQIESYDPIPPQLISALDYQIPIIDETPAQILESEGDYSDSDDLSTILNLLNILNTFPTGGEQLDLSQYLPGAPATGDAGSTDGDNGTSAFSDFQNFVNNLESSTDNVVTLPVFDNVQQSIEQTLLGQPVTLVQLNTGPINYTASTGSITFLPSTPVFDIGIASVNLSITGGASISLTGDLDIGLSNRGLLADGLINSNGTPNTTPNLLDGFFIDDGVGTNFPGLGMQQLALEVNAYVTITGSLDLGGFLSVASISGSLGPYGEVGVRVNSLVPNAQGTGFLTSSSPPYLYEIAGYDGAPQGNGMAYLDEISYIAQNYGPLCAVMPDGQVGLQLNVNGTVGYPPIGFTFNVINQQFPIANFDFPCVPTAGTLAEVEGNELVMLPNILGTGSGENTISAGVLYSPTNQNVPIGIDLVESNQSNIVFQTFTFAQLNGVNTLVMNGDEGNDTYNFDPSLSLTTITGDFGGALVNTANPAPIQYLEINTEDGNDTVKLTNVTPQNSSLLGVTIHGGNGNDFFQGCYCPDLITLGYGTNTALIGTGNGEVIESLGTDSVGGGDGNDSVIGGAGPANIDLGDGNNVVQQGPGSENLLLGNGKNLVTASTINFTSGIASNGSSLTSGVAAAPTGTQVGYLTGNSAISQYVATGWVTTLTYALVFDAAMDPTNSSAGAEQIQVLDNGNVIDTIDPTTTAYQNYTVTFNVSSTTVSAPGSNTTTTVTGQVISFRGIDPSEGNNTDFIAVPQIYEVAPLLGGGTQLIQIAGGPQLSNANFSAPALTAGSIYNTDITPAPGEFSVASNSFTLQPEYDWNFIEEIGIDSVVAGNGENTIHGEIGGSNILVGNGQDIVYQSGMGSQSFDTGTVGGSSPTQPGGGNDFITVNPSSGGLFSINGAGGRSMLQVEANANTVLRNGAVITQPSGGSASTVSFTNIATLSVSSNQSNVSFDVSAWTGPTVEIDGNGSDSVVSNDNTNFTLTDSSLSRSDGTSFTLSGIDYADLTSGGSAASFDVSDWHGYGVMTAGSGDDTIIANGLTTATLTDSLLQRAGAQNLTLSGFGEAILGTAPAGGANVNATAFTGEAALLGEGNNNTLRGGSGSDYIVGGMGDGNLLVGNGTVDNEIIGGAGGADSSEGGAGENLLVSSDDGGDLITTSAGPSHVYTPGPNNTINAQNGNAIIYNGTSGNTVNTGSSTTDQVLTPSSPGTVPSDFIAPTTTDLWEFPALPVPPTATLPTGTAALGQWVQYGTSASGGGVSDSPDTAIEPSIVATGSGSSSDQYLAWADNRSGTYQIYVAEDNSSGWKELAGSAHLGGVSDATSNATQPSIALDSSGNPMVAWTESGNIYVADYSPTANGGAGAWVALGSSLGGGGVSGTGDASDPILVESSAGPVVAWLDTSSGAANVFVKLFNGTSWTALGSGAASGKGISGSSSSVSDLALAASGSDVAAAWSQPGTSAGTSIYLLQYSGSSFAALGGSDSGTGISGSVAAVTPTIAYAGGTLYAAWAADTDGTNNIVAAESTGSSWTAISISTPSAPGVNQVSRGAASDPVLSANGSSLDLIWAEDRLPGTPDQAVAIYANRLSGNSFVAQLPGDSSFDGILGRPTSLSQPATLTLAVDAAGHPFVAWGDNSSGASQVYMLGDTLNVSQIYYVNGPYEVEDSFATASGSSSANGLTPSTPIDSISDLLGKYTMQAGDVILVDAGTYGGFSLGSSANGALILGSPGGLTTFSGAVSIAGVSNLTLQSLDFSGGISLPDDSNIELNNDIGGPENKLAHNEGGSVSMSDSSNVSLNNDRFTGVALNTGGLSNISLIADQLPGSGLTINGSVTGLLTEDNTIESLFVNAASQGVVSGNVISGGGVSIQSNFTGSIIGNFISGAHVGVAYSAAAPLNGNQIFDNQTGVVVTTASGGLGYFANSTPNFIVNNGTGVDLLGVMQGQYISYNDIGVSGSGVLGGTSLATANQITGNTTGVNFDGTVQFNRIDYNETSIVVQNGQLIDHNLIYDNDGQNLQTLGANDVEIYNNSFYSPDVDNILVNGGSSDVEIINNILWTGGGFDLDINSNSTTGYFSDYNDLYTTGAGQIVHYYLNFDDILDWQDDVALYDLHSIGTTVVNPTAAQPQFVNLGFGDFQVYVAAAGQRKTSPTIATGDPETDLGLPSSYLNQLSNPSFESGTTGWTVNPGGVGISTGGFENEGYFSSGAVAAGYAQQTISLLTAGYTAAQIDAGTLDISFGGRIESGVKIPPDQGELVLTFLNSSGATIGTPTTVTATNQTTRWELVGARVHVPVGARSVMYSFESTRESGSTDESYLSTAFLYVLVNTVATDMGAFGATTESLEEPVDEKIDLETPSLYVNWTLTQSHNILWSTFGNTGDDPVRIDLYQNVDGTLTFVTNITPSTPDSGEFAWIPQSSGLNYGTTGLVIKVSLVGQGNIYDQSAESFTVPANGTIFYVNSATSSAGQYTTVAGNNRATGLSPEDPLPLLTTLFRTYTLGAEDTVYVDNGSYDDFAPVEISGNPAIGSGQGVTIIGPTNPGDSAVITALSFTYPAVIDVNDGDFVTLENLTLTGADLGVWIHDGSNEFVGSNLTATKDGFTSVPSGVEVGGIRIESDSSSATFRNITTSDNVGDGFYAGGPIISLTGSTSFGNTADGFDLPNAGAAVLTDDSAYNNNTAGLVVGNSTGGTTVIGNANLALGLGNQFYNNGQYGIYVSTGSVLIAGNTVYGQSSKNAVGINTGGQTVTDDVVYNNYTGINASGGTLSFNNVYGNTNVGIEGDGGSAILGNVADFNGIGIQSNTPSNSASGPYINNNLVYDNTVGGIALNGGNNAQIDSNTVYQPTGDAINIQFLEVQAGPIQVENNILWTEQGYDIVVTPSSEIGFKSDYNDLYVTGQGDVGQWQNISDPTLTNWIDATNNDPDSISTDPLFVNTGTDFNVQSTTGSFHGGLLAPILGGAGLPVADPGSLTADANESPTIDRGDPTFSYANEPSPNGGFINLGFSGDTSLASLSPSSYVLVLKPPAGSTLIEGQNYTITWRSQNTAGNVNIYLMQGSTVAATIASAVVNSGAYVWAIPSTLTAEGGYTISVSRTTTPATGIGPAFTLNGPVTTFFVNANSTGGVYTTAGGNDANSGLDPADPKATIQALLAQYTIGAGCTIYIDEGTYNLTSNIILTTVNSGVTLDGVAGLTILNRGNYSAGAYDIDVQTSTGITIENLTLTGGYYGLNGSYNNGDATSLTVTGCTFYGDSSAGLYLDNNNSSTPVLAGDVINGNTFTSTALVPANYGDNFLTNPLLPSTILFANVGSSWTYTGGAGYARYNYSQNPGNAQQIGVLTDTGTISQATLFSGAGTYSLGISAAALEGTGPVGESTFEVLIDNTVVANITTTTATYQTFNTSEFTVGAGTHTITLEGLNVPGANNTTVINYVTFASLPNPYGLYANGIQVAASNNIANNQNIGFYISSTENSTISGNTIDENGVGLEVSNSSGTTTLSGNSIFDNYGDNLEISGSGLTATGNTVYEDGKVASSESTFEVGIVDSGALATQNTVYGNDTGIEVSSGTASYNLVYNNVTAGITGVNGVAILGNVLYGNGVGISLSIASNAATGGPVVENNLVYNNTNGDVNISGGDNTPFLNNTLYQSSGTATALQITSTSTTNLEIRDNIIWVSGGVDISIGAAAVGNVTSDYNDLYVTGAGSIGIFSGVTYSTLAAWQAASQLDADSFSANPLFVNAAAGDFHVESEYGSFHGGSLVPPLSAGTLTDDSANSPTIDRGAPGDPYSAEPAPNGGYVNLGNYGDTSQASLSAAHYLFVINPTGGQTLAAGQPYEVTWRDEVSNTTAGASLTNTIELVENGTVYQSISAPDVGSVSFTPSTSLPSGTYQFEVIRNDGTGLTALSGAFNLQAFTGIYYVAINGSDSNSGLSATSPKADIQAIFTSYTLQPGNIIMVGAGSYTLSTNLTMTAPEDGITIEGVAGQTTLNRANVNSGDYVFDFQGATNVTLQGLTITSGYYGINGNYGETLSGLTINTCTFYGSQNDGIYIEGNNGSATITGCTFEATVSGNGIGFQSYAYANAVTLTGNTAYNLEYGFYVSTSNSPVAGTTINGNTAYDCDYGIDASDGSSQPMVVDNNITYDNYDINLELGGSLTATGNMVYEDGKAGSNESSREIGVSISSGQFIGNSVYGNVTGISFSSGQFGSSIVSGNAVYNNTGVGITMEDGDTVNNNIIYNNGSWAITGAFGYGSPSLIVNNLMYDNVAGGMDISGAYETVIQNNTVYAPTGIALEVTGSLTTSDAQPPLLVQNNIFWVQAPNSFDLDVSDSAETGFTSDYNDLYATGSGQIAQMAGANFATLPAWSYELGLDVHSISANPQFVSIGTNFHVQSNSPTIDAGNPASEFISEPSPNGGRINLGYDGDTPQAATSPSATSVQVASPATLQKLQVGVPTTINWLTTGLLSEQTITEVGAGETNQIGEYHPEEFQVGSPTLASDSNTINTSAVTNPAPPAVYQTYAESGTGIGSTLAYLIPVNNGTYTIRLDFSEPQVATVGARTFDVILNGQTVQSAFDIYSAAGKVDNKAVSLSFNVTASGGTGISLVLKTDEASYPAILNGFEISQAVAGGAASQTVNVEVSTNGGSSWSTIATNQPLDLEGKGSFTWTPTVSTNDAIVQVIANNTASTAGTSGPIQIAPGGTVFYVNGNSTLGAVYTTAVGNNANNGKTPATPMASVEAVLNDYPLGPGDIIDVDNGNYTLFHDINLAPADSGITITGPTATSGGTAVLNRNNTSTGDYVFNLLSGASNITIENLSITGANTGVYSSNSTGNSGITLAFNSVYSNNGGIEDGGIYAYGATGWLVTGNTVHDNSFTSNATFGIYITDSTANITNNTVYNEGEYDILFGTPVYNTIVANNNVSGNLVYASEYGIAASQATVTSNVAYDNTEYGIYASSGAVVSGNTVYKQTTTNAIGIFVNGAVVSGNRIYDNYIGLEAEGGSALTLYDNSIYSNLNYGMVINAGTGSPSTYPQTAYNNLVYANSVGGIEIINDENLLLFDNTVYQLIGDAVNLSGTSNPLTIENNILWVQAGYDLDFTSTSSQTGVTSNYNDLYNIGANAYVGKWNGTAYSTLTNWQAASSEDARSIDSNPNFVDPTGADGVLGYNATANGGNGYNGGNDDNFFVAAGSPTIAIGNAAVQPTNDMLGYTRVNADLGAYAYRGGNAYTTAAVVTNSTPGNSVSGSQINQITVTFSQPPNDIDADAPALYTLVSTTNNTVYSLTPVFTAGGSTVVLSISPAPLVGGQYVFTILSSTAASVHNLNGIPLDGANNGQAGTNFVQTFSVTQVSTSLSNLISATISYGTPSVMLSGSITSASGIPIGSVSIIINGVATLAPINASTGVFSASVNTQLLGASGSPYTITYDYLGSGSFAPTSNTSQTLTVTQVSPTVTLPPPPPNITYDGTTDVLNWAVATITGVSGAAAPTGSASNIYYVGITASGTPLASPPENPGTYTVVADYPGDVNYLSAQSAAVTFTINEGSETFTGSVNATTWNIAGNWSLNIVPNQYLNTTVPAGFPNLTIGTGTFAVGSLTSSSPIAMNGSSLTINGPASFTNGALTINSSATLTLNPGSSFAGNIVDNGGVVVDFTGDPALAANISGSGTLTVTGPGTVELTGDNTYTGLTTVSSGELAILAADALPVRGPIVNNATVQILVDGTTPVIAGQITGNGTLLVGSATTPGFLQLAPGGGNSQQSSIVVAPGSTLDISSNTVLINYGSGLDPILAIQTDIDTGYNGGTWSGEGIISTAVAAANVAAAGSVIYGIGYADGADGIVGGLGSGQIELLPTLDGDARLTGTVSFGDFQTLSQYFGRSGGWDKGSFNYGGTVNFGDFQLLAQNFGRTSSIQTGAGSFNITFTGAGDGTNWSNPANWSGDAVPNQYDNVTIPAGVASLHISSGKFTAASITSASPLTLSSGAALTLLGPANFSGSPLTISSGASLQVDGGSVTGNVIDNGSLMLNFSNDPTLPANISGSGALTSTGQGMVNLTGDNTYTGPTTISAGALVIGSASSLPAGAAVSIGGAALLRLAPGIGPTTIDSLSIASGGSTDITNNTLFIDYAAGPDPISSITADLTSGYNGGHWNGVGIFSSSVSSLNATQNKLVYGVGYADGADGVVGGPASGTIEIMPTLVGDAKLQGNVVFGDFQILAEYFGKAGSWDEGNFTYGSAINFGDFQLLAQNFGQTSGLSASKASPSLAPADEFSDLEGQQPSPDEQSLTGSLLEGAYSTALPIFSDVALDLG